MTKVKTLLALSLRQTFPHVFHVPNYIDVVILIFLNKFKILKLTASTRLSFLKLFVVHRLYWIRRHLICQYLFLRYPEMLATFLEEWNLRCGIPQSLSVCQNVISYAIIRAIISITFIQFRYKSVQAQVLNCSPEISFNIFLRSGWARTLSCDYRWDQNEQRKYKRVE